MTEAASRFGRGSRVPRWITWKGWPFVAFALTTVYGQMVSVYQYPKPALLILGGSTLGAIVVGYLYGRNNRVWCRYLCPVNGVFGVLAKLAPVHFRVDEEAWARSRRSGNAGGQAGQLRAARRDQDHARRLGLSYVRPLQRLSRRHQPRARARPITRSFMSLEPPRNLGNRC